MTEVALPFSKVGAISVFIVEKIVTCKKVSLEFTFSTVSSKSPDTVFRVKITGQVYSLFGMKTEGGSKSSRN